MYKRQSSFRGGSRDCGTSRFAKSLHVAHLSCSIGRAAARKVYDSISSGGGIRLEVRGTVFYFTFYGNKARFVDEAHPSSRGRYRIPYFSGTRAGLPRVPGKHGDVVEPKSFSTRWIAYADETSYRGRSLRWKGWGNARTTGSGRLTHCVIEYEKCHTYKGRIQFRRPMDFGGCGGVSYPFYTQIRIWSHGSFTRWATFLDCS